MSSGRFQGQVVLVTGASSGIGEAAARAFAREGATVVLCARGAEALGHVAADIERGGGRALAVPTDVADLEACRRLVDRAVTAFGGLDVLVNNAGAHHRGPIGGLRAEQLAEMVHVNLAAPIVLTRLALDHLRKPGAAVVNVASLAGHVPLPNAATYSATKFGLRAFSFAIGEELREAGIKVSVVSPGPVETPFILETMEEVDDVVFAQPMSTAEEIAAMILDCAADGRRERMTPKVSGYLALLGYLVPPFARMARPLMQRRGARVKERYRRARKAAAGG